MSFSDRFKNVFEPELLEQIEAKARIVTAKEGDVILEVGQPVRFIPILNTGIIKVARVDESGKEILLYYINANESCVMTFTCCMEQHPSEIRATAESDVEFVAIPIGVMDEWMAKYSTWKSFVMRTIKERINKLLLTIDLLAFQKLDERLVHFLKEKSRITGSTLINLSHEEIAVKMASSREVISRLLKKLENEKKVLLYRNQIKILRDL
ncbi:MAG: Crp/Fnr family transcriptional regulator [Saprospiraceae bacterium]|nr:Crp/Fnr family transcriptional regulator [Saprospiraceae bacterium]